MKRKKIIEESKNSILSHNKVRSTYDSYTTWKNMFIWFRYSSISFRWTDGAMSCSNDCLSLSCLYMKWNLLWRWITSYKVALLSALFMGLLTLCTNATKSSFIFWKKEADIEAMRHEGVRYKFLIKLFTNPKIICNDMIS